MKRLIKKSNLSLKNIITGINEWIDGDGMRNNSYNNFFDSLINEHSDCIVNTNAYRIFYFSESDVFSSIYQIIKNSDIDNKTKNDIFENDAACIEYIIESDISKSFIQSEFKKLINNDNRYCSWSETESGVESVKGIFTDMEQNETSMVIQANINGLSLNKLIDKLNIKSDFNNDTIILLDQEELISKMPNDYTIIEIGNARLY